MSSYLTRRLLLILPTLLIISIIVFLSQRLIPGSVIDMIATEYMGSKIDRNEIEDELGLNLPIQVQYIKWLGNIVIHGDLGNSLRRNVTVNEQLKSKIPVTLELVILGTLINLLIALPIGVYSAVRQNSWGDYVGRSIAILSIAVPSFWIALIVVTYPAIWWGWSPPMQYIPFTENLAANLSQFLIPSFIMGMSLAGITMRMTRTMMLEVLRLDYIRTAWSKGLTERMVVMRHALRNALIPVVTLVGVLVPGMIGGAVIIEQIFVLPGLGRLAFESLNNRDYTTVSGINLFIAMIVLLTNLAVDLTYAFLDPRIKYK